MSHENPTPAPGPRPPAPFQSHESPTPAPGLRPLAPFLMAGGGPGGHVMPALAVARELRKRGHAVFFVGTERGLESKLVPAEGFELKRIEVGGLNQVSLGQKGRTLTKLPFTPLGCLR